VLAERERALPGTAALIDLKLSDGSYLVEGNTVTGFARMVIEALGV